MQKATIVAVAEATLEVSAEIRRRILFFLSLGNPRLCSCVLVRPAALALEKWTVQVQFIFIISKFFALGALVVAATEEA